MFDARSLVLPVLGAPMAGGPSTPELVAAVNSAGGIGFLAAGYCSAAQVAEQIAQVRALSAGPVGVNLFVMAEEPVDMASIGVYRAALAVEAERLGVELGRPLWDDDGLTDKLEVVFDLRPEMVSFTFGTPGADVLHRLASLGIATAVTVTSVDEARLAVAHGADVLVVQGPEAGGHRGTFRVSDEPSSLPLTELVPAVVSLGSVPVVAAGGIMTAYRASELLRKGAVAVQVGTALLDTDEAGTAATHRAALHDPLIDGTLVTRAFTGRPARSLVNRFAREHADAPAAYPHIHHLTAPLRAAAMRVGDTSTAHLWAGTGYRNLQPGPARDVVLTIGAVA